VHQVRGARRQLTHRPTARTHPQSRRRPPLRSVKGKRPHARTARRVEPRAASSRCMSPRHLSRCYSRTPRHPAPCRPDTCPAVTHSIPLGPYTSAQLAGGAVSRALASWRSRAALATNGPAPDPAAVRHQRGALVATHPPRHGGWVAAHQPGSAIIRGPRARAGTTRSRGVAAQRASPVCAAHPPTRAGGHAWSPLVMVQRKRSLNALRESLRSCGMPARRASPVCAAHPPTRAGGRAWSPLAMVTRSAWRAMCHEKGHPTLHALRCVL